MGWRGTAPEGSRRGWRRWLPALAAVVAAAAAGAGPAQATVLSPTTSPLPGSQFQGADGNQDGTGLTDWQGRQNMGLVRHNPDPNAQDSAFSGGSKELEPGQWQLTTERDGVDPAKSNIRDAWASVDQPPPSAEHPAPDTFLYLGFTREKADGTSYLTFELNRDARLWNNGRSNIPCRRTGDILVSYEAQGNTIEVVLRRWVTLTTDANTGCARTGRVDLFTGLTANVQAQGAINATDIASHLPGAITGTVPAGQFGEAALNLSALLEQAFGDDCLAFASVWMHSRSSTSITSNMQDYVGPQSLAVRTCAASGTKFYDMNADGVRDSSEPGIPRFVIWADYDDDGVRDANEPYSVTDDQGRYVIFDIRPPKPGNYHLREGLLTGRGRLRAITDDWICSFPNDSTEGGSGSKPGRFPCAWGPINVNTTPNAGGRDFGNWYPASLTVRKQLEPDEDPGPFDILIDGTVVLPAARNGATFTQAVVPGTHTVSEVPVGDTNPADYRSSVDCRRNVNRRGRRRAATSASITLAAGEQGLCVFRNIRAGTPAIAIRKTGPVSAVAGDTLHYTFLVTNPGFVPFPAAGVKVTDPACDDPPELVDKQDDSGPDDTPGTLDPLVDTWTYSCSRRTTDPGDDCVETRVDNTGTVTGTVEGTTVDDSDSISTILTCPDRPEPPIPPEPPNPPGPEPPGPGPGPVVPPGPTPPDAGDSGVAGLVVRSAALRRCIRTHVPRVTFSGARVASVRIYVNGRRIRSLNLRTLQSRTRPRVTLAPGRYQVQARVTFQRGSGTPPVTLRRVIEICARAAAAPQFTG